MRVGSLLTLFFDVTSSRKQPCKVHGLGGHRLKQVCAGNEHTCVLSENGLVLVAGYNDNGQCGQGTTERVGKEKATQESTSVLFHPVTPCNTLCYHPVLLCYCVTVLLCYCVTCVTVL